MDQQTTENPPNQEDCGQGCYYIRIYRTNVEQGIDFYHGTFRIESLEDMRLASCDLYKHPIGAARPESAFGQPDAIPVFPRNLYSCHLEVAQVHETIHDDTSFQIRFKLLVFQQDTYSFSPVGFRRLLLTRTNPPLVFKNTMFGERFYTGEMRKEDGTLEGTIEMGRVSKNYFRRASLEIDCVPGCKAPRNNGAGIGWQEVFQDIGWKLDDLTIEDIPSEDIQRLHPHESKTWTSGQLHEAMQQFRRPSTDLDLNWHYHILVVPRIAGYGRGVMYDVEQHNPDSPPREGAALASDYYFPGKDEDSRKTNEGKFWQWTEYAGRCFSEVEPLYFRTAVHEFGHLLGLGHNQGDDGYMNASNIVAMNIPLKRAAHLIRDWGQACNEYLYLTQGNKLFRLIGDSDFKAMKQRGDEEMSKLKKPHYRQEFMVSKELQKHVILKTHETEEKYQELVQSIREFPENIQWRFNEKDRHFLRHGPDPAVRPGSRCLTDNLKHEDSDASEKAEGFQLHLYQQRPSFPLGAPIRLSYRLLNVTHRTSSPKWLPAPDNLSFKTGQIKFQVRAPNGTVRDVTPLLLADDEDDVPTPLGPGKSRSHSVTLFTSGNRCLFSEPGEYIIRMRIDWRSLGEKFEKLGKPANFHMVHSTSIVVTPPNPKDVVHQEEANRIIQQTEKNLLPAVRGNTEGREHSAKSNMERMQENSVLLPHYRVGLAKDYFERHLYQSKRGDYFALEKALENITENMVMTPTEMGKMLDIVEFANSRNLFNELAQRAKNYLWTHARAFRTTELGSCDDAGTQLLLERFKLRITSHP